MKHFGSILSGLYVLVSAYFIFTQGILGESFIALILGFPWSFGFAFFEFWGATGLLLYILLALPLLLNTAILYWIGSHFNRSKITTTLAKSEDVSITPATAGSVSTTPTLFVNGEHSDAATASSTDASSGGGGDGGGASS